MDYAFVTGDVYRATCPYCNDGTHIVGLAAAFAWGRDHANTQHPERTP